MRHVFAWIVLALCLTFVGVGLTLQAQTTELFAVQWKNGGMSLSAVAWAAMYLVFGTVGALLLMRSASQAIGWLCLALGFIQSLAYLLGRYAAYALFQLEGRLPGGEWAAWVGYWMFGPTLATLGLLLMLFPDSRFASPLWRVVALVGAAAVGAQTLAVALKPGPTMYSLPEGSLVNPAGVEWLAGITEPLSSTAGLAAMLLLLSGGVSLLARYRRATSTRRAQIRYLAAAAGAVVFVFVAFLFAVALGSAGEGLENPWLGEVFATLLPIAFASVPLAIGAALLPRAPWIGSSTS
jgi:hypothetical protein